MENTTSPKEKVTHFIRIRFLVSFKEGWIIFSFQTHLKIVSGKQVFLHLSPLTIPQFFFSFEKGIILFVEEDYRGKYLISDSKYIESMKKHTCETLCLLDNQHITDEHLRCEYLKYGIRKFTKKYAQAVAENARKETDSLEIELKHLETDLKKYQTSQKYLDRKSKQDEIYSKKANGVRIRSKCDWYQSGESLTNSFQTLKKLVPLKF